MNSNFNLERIFNKPIEHVDDIIKNIENHVRHIEIPKSDGSKRKILAPDSKLKYIQKGLYYKILMRYRPNVSAHGFVKKKGIVTNAIEHVKPLSFGHIDIKNFFDSISEKHLSNCLFGNKNICRFCNNYEGMLNGKCNPSLYKMKSNQFSHKCEEMKAVFIPEYCEKTGYESLFKRMIKLCTYKGFTAQGFPTSPILANIVLRGFDQKILQYCTENNIIYTRYADDLSFSSKAIEKDELKKLMQNMVYNNLRAFNFAPNKKKTFWKSNKGRIKICGVVVNEKLSVLRSSVHLFRAKVHNATVKDKDKTTKTILRKLKGWASYLMSIDKIKGQKYMGELKRFEDIKFPKPITEDLSPPRPVYRPPASINADIGTFSSTNITYTSSSTNYF